MKTKTSVMIKDGWEIEPLTFFISCQKIDSCGHFVYRVESGDGEMDQANFSFVTLLSKFENREEIDWMLIKRFSLLQNSQNLKMRFRAT